MNQLLSNQNSSCRWPCRRCAIDTVLYTLGTQGIGPGYRVLRYDSWHDRDSCST